MTRFARHCIWSRGQARKVRRRGASGKWCSPSRSRNRTKPERLTGCFPRNSVPTASTNDPPPARACGRRASSSDSRSPPRSDDRSARQRVRPDRCRAVIDDMNDTPKPAASVCAVLNRSTRYAGITFSRTSSSSDCTKCCTPNTSVMKISRSPASSCGGTFVMAAKRCVGATIAHKGRAANGWMRIAGSSAERAHRPMSTASSRNHRHHGGRRTGADLDQDVGIRHRKALQRARDQIADESLAHAERHAAAPQMPVFLQSCRQIALTPLIVAIVLDQHLPDFGDDDIAPAPLDQRKAQQPLQRRDLPADHRRVDAERFRRHAHAARRRDFGKITQRAVADLVR